MVWESDKFIPLNLKGLVATIVSLKNDSPVPLLNPIKVGEVWIFLQGLITTAVGKDPNRHRTQTSILDFRISEIYNKKKKGKCYKTRST